MTITKEHVGKDEYNEIKEICLEYGIIEEAVYENGNMYLNIVSDFNERLCELELRLENYANIELARG